MKPKVTISIAAFALIGLITIQYFLISGLYRLKKNEFDTKYGNAVREALIDMQDRFKTNGLDTVFYLMDMQALELVDEYSFTVDDPGLTDLNQNVLELYQFVIEKHERVSAFIKAYLTISDMDPEFLTGYLIRDLQIIDQDRIFPVYQEMQDQAEKQKEQDMKSDAIHVNNFRAEGNFFRINFDLYIDFTHKTTIIFKEMTGAFVLALISILVAGAVFMFTIQNMLKHKNLSELKTDFINNMAHELKTPLTTISVASSTLAETEKNPDKDKIVGLSELIKEQNKQLSKLIDHILDINLWEKNQISLRKSEVNLSNLLKTRIEAFRIEHADKSFSVTDQINLDGVKIDIDEFQFTIALHNLFSNALKYGGNPPEIHIGAGIETDHVYIKVKDNGKGIRYDEQSQIFSKFYRGKGTPNKSGLGLGLFYVKEIIELHGGIVEVFSKLGHGSTFVIRLPLKAEI